jgi:uncharacterized membrane protein
VNRRQADIVAGVLIAAILLAGIVTAAQLVLSDRASMGSGQAPPVMMVVGPVLMTLVVASLVAGSYVYLRGQLLSKPSEPATAEATDAGQEPTADRGPDADKETDAHQDTDTGTDGRAASREADSASAASTQAPDRQLLDVLPDDERQILEPVLESPGLTQIEVRDRSGFSKSKVSQTITDLEKRGLVSRERAGRTYRVYPADDIDEQR